MGFLVDEEWVSSIDRKIIKSGYVQKNKRVYKGVIRYKDDIIWECDHAHSRPEYNSRHYKTNLVWEYAALQCGKTAANQLRLWVGGQLRHPDESSRVRGEHGLIAYENVPYSRQDEKSVEVGDAQYRGRLTLREDGYRILEVTQNPVEVGDLFITGGIFLDAQKDTSLHPKITGTQLTRWLTAAAYLHADVWGLTFRNPQQRISVEVPDPEIAKAYLPKSTDLSDPHVRTVREGGKRKYQVIDRKGKVIETYPHRGRAVKHLESLEQEAS